MYPCHVLPVSLERCNPYSCCKCTFPSGNKNVKLLQNKLKSYVARLLSNLSCNKSGDQAAALCVNTNVWPKKNLRDSHTIPGSYVTCCKTSLPLPWLGRKTRSMCRFCCKKDNVSQPATTWFLTREVFSGVLPKFYVFDGQHVIKRISES